MQVNALFKKSAPAPAKTATKTKTVKKSAPAPAKKAAAPFKKAVAKPAPVKKVAAKKVAPRKAAPTKVAKGDALAKWYGTYAFPEKESFVRSIDRVLSRFSLECRRSFVRLRLRRDRIGNSAMQISKDATARTTRYDKIRTNERTPEPNGNEFGCAFDTVLTSCAVMKTSVVSSSISVFDRGARATTGTSAIVR